jgi:hypothetical protein
MARTRLFSEEWNSLAAAVGSIRLDNPLREDLARQLRAMLVGIEPEQDNDHETRWWQLCRVQQPHP